MNRDELEVALGRRELVMHKNKAYRIRSVVTKNIADLPAANVDSYVTRNRIYVDLAELYDPRSNMVFNVLASEVYARENKEHSAL